MRLVAALAHERCHANRDEYSGHIDAKLRYRASWRGVLEPRRVFLVQPREIVGIRQEYANLDDVFNVARASSKQLDSSSGPAWSVR